MADFSKPVTTDTYANVLTYLKATTIDLALGLDPANTTPTNVPTNAVCWDSVSAKWKKWNGTGWNDLASAYAINISGNAAGLSATLAIASGGTGATTAAAALVSLGERTGTTGSAKLPAGTTAQRDATPASGYIRFNSDTVQFEGYNGTGWTSVGGGAKGGGADQVFFENGQTVTNNYTITSGKNAMAAGPVTVNSGVTVTIPSGSRWVVV